MARITNYLKVMQAAVSEKTLLKPMGKALATLERHAEAVVRRWHSGLTSIYCCLRLTLREKSA